MIDRNQHRRAELLGSLLLFTQVFYKLRTGRDFELSEPIGRESHYITICKSLTKVFNGEIKRLIINVPPRYGKTELCISFIAWTLAHYPDSNNLYISYAHSLAKKQTQTVRQIIDMPDFRRIFNVHLSDDTSAKDNFETSIGGSVYAVGAGGTITGRGAGIKNCDRYGGAIIIDDIHKPSEVSSDTMRDSIIEWYDNTLQSRVNSPDTPIILTGQCLHESDLVAHLAKKDEWHRVILPALDRAGNALHPQMHNKEQLLKMEEEMPYVFSAQYQQDPQPAGGGIFKPEWFVLLDEEPDIVSTFITADTAETDKDYNDATVFSFWGVYRIKEANVDIDLWGLHWIDCVEIRVEPKDLEYEFNKFYAECMHYKVKPQTAVIEKKSTGVTLVSVLKAKRGLHIIEIERTKASGSKTARYLEAQSYVASKRISFNKHAKHVDLCIEHCRKITANNTHRHDDIADTMYDAVKISLIDEFIQRSYVKVDDKSRHLAAQINGQMNALARAKERAYYDNR